MFISKMEEEQLIGKVFNQIQQMLKNYANFERAISFLEDNKFSQVDEKLSQMVDSTLEYNRQQGKLAETKPVDERIPMFNKMLERTNETSEEIHKAVVDIYCNANEHEISLLPKLVWIVKQ